MPSISRKFYPFLICSSCGGELSFNRNNDSTRGPLRNATLSCVNCHSDFCIKNYVPYMLPPKFSQIFLQITKDSNNLTLTNLEIVKAREWLIECLQIPYEELPKSLPLFRNVATILKICSQFELDPAETYEIIGMWGSCGMASHYRKCVADQMYGSLEATSYEKYEDILLRKVMNTFLQINPVVLIELGSGVGRLLHQYASCISPHEDAALPYRRHLSSIYTPSSLINSDNLKLILGMDFQERMIKLGTRWLQEDKLYNLVRQGRVAQIIGSTYHIPFSFNHTPYENATKVVCILFQTLGNQLSRELQIDMIKKAWQIALPHGLVFVSTFNVKAFDEQAPAYYSSIRKSVGAAIYIKDGTFLSSRGVYSRWFKQEDLKRLFIDAGMKDFIILDSDNLNNFPEYERYVETESQSSYKKRALIGMACSDAPQLTKLKRLLSSSIQ